MNFRKSRRAAIATIVCAVSGIFSVGMLGCGGGNGGNTVSNVRVFDGLINASANSGINVALRTIGTAPVNSSPTTFGNVSANAKVVSGDGVNTIAYVVNANSPQTLVTNPFDYKPNNNALTTDGYLLILTGVVGQIDTTLAPQMLRIPTSVPTTLIRGSSGNALNFAAVRVVHAASGSPTPISIYNDTSGSALIGGLDNVAYGQASAGGSGGKGYVIVPTGNPYTLSVRDTTGNSLLSVSNVNFQPGFAYTLIAYGSSNATFNSPLKLALVQDYPLQ